MAFDQGLILVKARAGNFTRQQPPSFTICTRASYYIYVLPRVASAATSSSWSRLCRALQTSFRLSLTFCRLPPSQCTCKRTRALCSGGFSCSHFCFQKGVGDAIHLNDCTRLRLICRSDSTTKSRQHRSLGNLLERLHIYKDASEGKETPTKMWHQLDLKRMYRPLPAKTRF